MCSKYTIDAVKDIFFREGYTVLSDTYVNNKIKLKVLCPNGHETCINLNNFLYNKRRCSICANNSRLTISYVRQELLKSGYILLSDQYKNAHTKLKCMCKFNHTYEMTWSKFKQGQKCPFCSHRRLHSKITLAYKYPSLAKEWHPTKNGSLTPKNVFFSSNKIVWWQCLDCNYEWRSSINNRTNKIHKRGCPSCSNTIVTEQNNLKLLVRDVAAEWDLVKNNGLLPEDVTPGSNKKVWWKCKKCGYGWKACVVDRTRGYKKQGNKVKRSTGCPLCAGMVINSKNNLMALFPEVAKDWDEAENKVSAKSIFPYSNKRVWWKCAVCGHRWETAVYNRTCCGSGCPVCVGGPISRVSQKWLDYKNVPKKYREFKIMIGNSYVKVDGYDPGTNTVYEFLGDYWHGNPEVYSPAGINKHNKKTFGSLYKETFYRFQLLEKDGYIVDFIWENDFKELD